MDAASLAAHAALGLDAESLDAAWSGVLAEMRAEGRSGPHRRERIGQVLRVDVEPHRGHPASQIDPRGGRDGPDRGLVEAPLGEDREDDEELL